MPTASLVHFLTLLVLAAPASFLSVAAFVQAAAASFSHFFTKLFLAAPDNFFSAACAWQLESAWATVFEQETTKGDGDQLAHGGSSQLPSSVCSPEA